MSYDDRSLFALFQQEAKAQSAKLASGLIALEAESSPMALEELMRAAHSLKGAARIVGHEGVAAIAHELEECFVAAQAGLLSITANQIDVLLGAVDLLSATALVDPEEALEQSAVVAREELLHTLRAIAVARSERGTDAVARDGVSGLSPRRARVDTAPEDTDRLLTLASEALVATRSLTASVNDDGRDRWADQEISRAFDSLGALLVDSRQSAIPAALSALHASVASLLSRRRERAFALDSVSQRVSSAVSQLYEGVLDARMLPFGNGIVGLPRLVRDTARELGREVDLVTLGENTPVDREVLRRLDAPLGHLIRNAVDHGIEPPAERAARGKSSTRHHPRGGAPRRRAPARERAG